MNSMNLVLLWFMAFTVDALSQEVSALVGDDASQVRRSITIEQAIEATVTKNYWIKSDSLEIDVQSANKKQVELPDNPDFVIESDNIGLTQGSLRNGMPLSFQIEQSFRPYARLKRIRVANAGIEIAHVNLQKQKQDLIAEVKTRFVTVLALQKVKILGDSLVEISSNAHRVSVGQASSGKVSASDSLKTSAEFALSRIRRDRDYQSLSSAYQALVTLWNSTNVNIWCQGSELDLNPFVPDSASVFAKLSNSADYKIFVSELDKENAKLELEKIVWIPSIRIGGGVEIVRGTSVASPRASLSLSLPFLNWNQGAIEAARYGVLQAEFKRKAIQTQIYRNVLNTYRAATRIHNEIRTFNTNILPQFKESLDASYTAYVSGKVGVLAVVDAQRSFYEASRNFIEMHRDLQFSLIELERLTSIVNVTLNALHKE